MSRVRLTSACEDEASVSAALRTWSDGLMDSGVIMRDGAIIFPQGFTQKRRHSYAKVDDRRLSRCSDGKVTFATLHPLASKFGLFPLNQSSSLRQDYPTTRA